MRAEPSQRTLDAPLSPVLLLGLVLEKLPVRLVQPVLDGLLRIVLRRHPGCLERMAEWGQARVLVDPIDLPFVILLRPDPQRPSLKAMRRGEAVEADAVIRGPLGMLIELAEGRVDGDTLFFSRELIVEGDTEVVVALRNAVDGAGIDMLADIAAALGPFGRPFRAAAGAGTRLAARMRRDLATFGAAVIAPALRRSDAQAFRLAELEDEVKALRKQKPRPNRHARDAS
ncbi:MAG: SCP2 sterol-binding domain-containing protein [Pseudomonadota bacterium]|nr:SCP2 sterol-binding domain-containing protein [Pseudomonadota bacterium]